MEVLVLFSALTFLFYGFSCIFHPKMQVEFERYGLTRFRNLTGTLEILGGLGQILGLFFAPPLLVAASLGLAMMMLLGIGVRVRIKDRPIQILPAIGLFCLNVWILYTLLIQ